MRLFFILLLLGLTSCTIAQKTRQKDLREANRSIQLDGGIDFSCVLINGQLWYWGSNLDILPDTINRIARPSLLLPGKKIKSISCSGDDLIALDENGAAWGWGRGDWFKSSWQGEKNEALDEKYKKRIYPVKLFDSIRWSKVSISRFHFAGVKPDGTLWVVGRDECKVFGGLFYANPLLVGKDKKWVDVSLSNTHGSAITENNTLWTWGNNGFGQVGVGAARTLRLYDDCKPFQQVPAGDGWQDIDVCTTNTVAIRKDGSLWFWGDSVYNPLEPRSVLTPMQIGGNAKWISASAGESHTLAVREDGSLWARGSNTYGQLGDGTTIKKNELVRIGNDNDWVSVKAASVYFSLAVKKDGTIWAWGNNENGQLGDGTRVNRSSPQKVNLKVL